MATLVHIDKSNDRGRRIAESIQMIRSGLAVLEELDGMRAQTISVSADKFGATFGIDSDSEAQAFNDRWASIAAGTYTGLSDFLDATLAD